MKHYNIYRFDSSAAGSQLQRLSNLFLWYGIGLIGLLCVGMPLNILGDAEGNTLISVLLTVIGATGFGCLMCSIFVWRTVFGIFPNVVAHRGPDAM
jgi:fatty acid desaturase